MSIFLISLITGLSTMIGTIFIFFNYDKDKVINYSLSFTSGVMLSISIFDLIPEALKLIKTNYNYLTTFLLFILFFLIGFIISLIINKIIKNDNKLYKTGIISMIGLIMHNIPEGILTYASYKVNKDLGINIAILIAMHNIPEGIAISIPIYYSTNSKIRAISYTLISAISEPFGAILSSIFIRYLINNFFLGIMFSIVSGIMIYLSIFELPKAIKKSLIFFLIGIVFILTNLII